MSMQLIVNIVVLTSLYALVACGYVLIYRVSRVLNMAHGELMMLGAYALFATASGISGNPVIALLISAVLSMFIGLATYQVLMRRLTGSSVLAAVLTTIAIGILIRGMVVLIWSPQPQYPARLLGLENPSLAIFGDARISMLSAVLIGVTVLVYSGLFLFLRFGSWGIRLRAVGQNALLAAQRGINLHAVFAFAWGISTFTASTAGMLVAMDKGLDSTMVMIGLKAFPAALVGGLDSLFGAILGALIIAVIEVLLIQYVDPLLSDVVPFLVLIVMLTIRPWGFFGTREQLDRV
ncbi:MAG: branched-chain amino acid ABC transporter permease [Betaproteobacteria bacterium]|nr:branched-chain amino acid ABC transporter permease [Betaproteobacteria bacterium]